MSAVAREGVIAKAIIAFIIIFLFTFSPLKEVLHSIMIKENYTTNGQKGQKKLRKGWWESGEVGEVA
ncbi:MAG: hypothetical protein Kow0090_20280 [Myxococcota bacterium]